jgi:hypothetical protein
LHLGQHYALKMFLPTGNDPMRDLAKGAVAPVTLPTAALVDMARGLARQFHGASSSSGGANITYLEAQGGRARRGRERAREATAQEWSLGRTCSGLLKKGVGRHKDVA